MLGSVRACGDLQNLTLFIKCCKCSELSGSSAAAGSCRGLSEVVGNSSDMSKIVGNHWDLSE